MMLFLQEWTSVLADVCSEEIESMISRDDLERSRRFVREEDRGRFLAARVGLHRILSRQYAAVSLPKDLRLGTNGKPMLADAGVHINWSHSGSCVAWIVGDHPCGIDIEIHDRHLSMDRGSLCTPFEREWLDAQESPEAAFLDLWTAKESVLKALGHGLSKDPRQVGIVPDRPGGLSAWSCQLGESVVGRTRRIESGDAIYSLSWCIIGSDPGKLPLIGHGQAEDDEAMSTAHRLATEKFTKI